MVTEAILKDPRFRVYAQSGRKEHTPVRFQGAR